MARSTTAKARTAAHAAAADAAREELADALRESGAAGPPQSGPDAAAAGTDTAEGGWRRFVVDVWITNLNATEFGIYKRARNRAKTRQFTSDMDIFAEVIEDGVRTGLLGYREDLWARAQGMDRRLVVKLFSGSLAWQATMDLMTGRSLQQTIGARGLPVMAFSINTANDSTMVYLERSANKWPLLPENFSFFLMDGDVPRFYRLKRHLIDWGMDYTLYDQRGEAVGSLDGKVFSIGGKWKGRVKAAHATRPLLTVMKLFGGMMIFNPECRRHMRRLYRDVAAGRIVPRIERQEADLYMNPRRVR